MIRSMILSCPVALAAVVTAGCGRTPASVEDLKRPQYTGKAWIVATPNPVPAGRRAGSTTVNWDTGQGSPGQVFVSVDGKPEKFFSSSPAYHQDAPVGRGSYEFRLYPDGERTKPLATVTVTRKAR
jgi:hypothetical protein